MSSVGYKGDQIETISLIFAAIKAHRKTHRSTTFWYGMMARTGNAAYVRPMQPLAQPLEGAAYNIIFTIDI